MEVAQLVRTVRLTNALSQSKLAAMAGVLPSTVWRIEHGRTDPTVSTLSRILQATGYASLDELRPVADVAAVAAARGVLEQDQILLNYTGADRWLHRWEAAGFVYRDGDGWRTDTPAELTFQAGQVSRLMWRSGLHTYRSAMPWEHYARSLAAANIQYTITGSVAANRLYPSVDMPLPVFYVQDISKAAAVLAEHSEISDITGTEFGIEPAANTLKIDPPAQTWCDQADAICLLPLDLIVIQGTRVSSDGLNWAAPAQVLIDCYSGIDRMPDQADMLAQHLGLSDA